jgi:hypothetical protein
MYVYMYVCMYYTYVCMYVCMYTNAHTHKHKHTHTHTHTHTGASLWFTGDYRGAAQAYETAVGIDAARVDAHYSWGLGI